jgi:nucleoside-diphosphate-sugar epimerase
MPQTVLVTGAFGNVGSRTIRHLLAAGHHVVATDLPGPKTRAVAAPFGNRIEVIWGDIRDPALWPRLLVSVDAVIHLAAVIPPLSDLNPELATSVNVGATEELIRRMEASTTAKRLIFASSMAIAGFDQHLRQPPLRVDEAPNPTDHYGRTKAECEHLVRASSLRWSILRITACPPVNIGIKDMESLNSMFSASPDGRVEVVHHDDCALAFANAVDCDEAVGKTLYIGGGEQCRSTAHDFYNRILAGMGLGPIRAEALRPGPAHFFGDWVDTEESQRLLQFQRHGMDDIVTELRRKIGWMYGPIRLLSPLITGMIERKSPHLKH